MERTRKSEDRCPLFRAGRCAQTIEETRRSFRASPQAETEIATAIPGTSNETSRKRTLLACCFRRHVERANRRRFASAQTGARDGACAPRQESGKVRRKARLHPDRRAGSRRAATKPAG